MNETIQLLKNHRSIRRFEEKTVPENWIQSIIEAGQAASTSSHVMAYSIIGITDEAIKHELYKVSGQPYVEKNGYLFVICADLNRNFKIQPEETLEKAKQNLESTEQFIVGTIDATLVTQNMVIAAESLGLGTCYLGSLRNDINRVDELLELPDYVIPLFGLALGFPTKMPETKPRLPIEEVFHENTYKSDYQQDNIDRFDETLADYYQSRSTNKKIDTWSKQMEKKYAIPTRLDVGPYVKNKKINRH